MLVLSRRPGEKVIIGKDIVITVARVNGDRVKIGIDAPPELRVLRGELCGLAIHPTSTVFPEPDCIATKY
jgi:carbon storage regulator